MGKASGQFIVRSSSDLHERLKQVAARTGTSLNDLCVQRLMVPSILEGRSLQSLRDALAVAEKTFQEALCGFVLYGSVARGQATDSSDVDVLFVVADSVGIDRQVYSRWDSVTKGVVDPRIEAHFAHLPAATEGPTGFWAEMALDGIVLFDRNFAVARHLARVRRDISDGRIVRRRLHGQSYWIDSGVA